MVTSFREIPIEQLCKKVTTGSTPLRSRREFYEGGTIDWYKTGELKDWYLEAAEERITQLALDETSVKLFPAHTVLLAMYGDGKTITSLGILRSTAATNQACSAMLVDERKCDPRYFFYALKERRHLLLNLAFGGAQRNLSGKLIKEFPLPVPELSVQRRIASILTSYDELIENSQRRIKILEAMARALYREWFVHFRFPGHENHPRVASPLGKIPKGWEVVALGALCEVTDYVANGSFAALKANVTYRDEPDYAVLVRGRDFNSRWDGRYVYVTEHSYRFLKKSALLPGDIVVTNVGNVGTTFLVPDLGCPMTLGPNSVLVKPRKGAAFFYLFLRSEEGQHEMKRITSGVAQPKFNKTDFRALRLLVPSDGVLQDFERNINPLNSFAEQLRRQIQNLRVTRDLLLPRLLSGQIDVKAA